MYRDNLTTTLCPQDANSMAVIFNLTETQEQANSVSEGLQKNWNELGPVAPELPDTISPFISGLEVSYSGPSCNGIAADLNTLTQSCKHTSYPETTIVQWTSCIANGVTCFIQTSVSSRPY